MTCVLGVAVRYARLDEGRGALRVPAVHDGVRLHRQPAEVRGRLRGEGLGLGLAPGLGLGQGLGPEA